MPATRHPAILVLLAALTFMGTAIAEPKPGDIGAVVATEDGGSYTYVQLELDGNKVWYAVPAAELKPGEKVVVPSGMPMKKFYSKVLDRTFDLVYFAGGINRAGAPEKQGALPPGHPPIKAATPQAPATFDFSDIERPKGGKTVEEIYLQKKALAEKPVIVQGIAVKVSNGIMGKNWIHLRDGSGKPGTDDLTVTTTNTVKIGTMVTASGVLAIDRDFGFGYKYSVLLEDAAMKAK
jgi:hypothetical protein